MKAVTIAIAILISSLLISQNAHAVAPDKVDLTTIVDAAKAWLEKANPQIYGQTDLASMKADPIGSEYEIVATQKDSGCSITIFADPKGGITTAATELQWGSCN